MWRSEGYRAVREIHRSLHLNKRPLLSRKKPGQARHWALSGGQPLTCLHSAHHSERGSMLPVSTRPRSMLHSEEPHVHGIEVNRKVDI